MNITQLANAIGFKETEYREILDLFIETAAAELRDIETALGSGNAEIARRAAHSMKGAAVNLGLADIGDAAARIEEMACDRRLADAADAFRELAVHLERVIRERAMDEAGSLLGASRADSPERLR